MDHQAVELGAGLPQVVGEGGRPVGEPGARVFLPSPVFGLGMSRTKWWLPEVLPTLGTQERRRGRGDPAQRPLLPAARASRIGGLWGLSQQDPLLPATWKCWRQDGKDRSPSCPCHSNRHPPLRRQRCAAGRAVVGPVGPGVHGYSGASLPAGAALTIPFPSSPVFGAPCPSPQRCWGSPSPWVRRVPHVLSAPVAVGACLTISPDPGSPSRFLSTIHT